MQLYYALYDSAEFTDGNYWTWSAPEIRALLNKFYGDVAAKHLPPKPNDLQNTDLWGGLVRLADWTVVYRYFDGNWDKQGRPQRYVLLTAWIPAGDAQRVDLLPIFNNVTFQHVTENAEDIPIPPPFAMKENWVAEKITADTFQDGEKLFNNLEQAMRSFAGVPSNRKVKFEIAHVKIIRTTQEQKFVLNVVPEPKPVIMPEPKPEPKPIVIVNPPKEIDSVEPETWTQTVLHNFSLLRILPIVGLLALCTAWFLGALSNTNKGPSPSPSGQFSQRQGPVVQVPITNHPQDQIKEMFRTLPPNEKKRVLSELQKIVDHPSEKENKGQQPQSKPEQKSSPSSSEPVSPRSNTLMEWWSAFWDNFRWHR